MEINQWLGPLIMTSQWVMTLLGTPIVTLQWVMTLRGTPIVTSQWVMTLLGTSIVTSKWVMTLLGTSIAMTQWVMTLLCVHVITMHNDVAMNLFYYVLLLLCVPIYVILLWVVWNKKKNKYLFDQSAGEHIRCFCVGLFHSSFGSNTHLFLLY